MNQISTRWIHRLIVPGLLIAGCCSGWMIAGGVRTLAEDKVWMYVCDTAALTERLHGYVYYVDKGVPLASVIEPGQPPETVGLRLAKGTRVRVLDLATFTFTAKGLSSPMSGGSGASSHGTATFHTRIVNVFDIQAAFIQILNGEHKNQRGWLVNHMVWLTSNQQPVNEVTVNDRLNLRNAAGGAFKIWEVELKNGRVIRTEVLEDQGDTVAIRTELGRVSLSKSRIKQIRQVDE